MTNKNNFKIIFFIAFSFVVFAGVFWFITKTGAFSGPPGAPGQFTGSPLKTDGTNFAIGTTVQPGTRLTIFGGSGAGLIVRDINSNPILDVGPNDVKIGNPTGDTAFSGSASLRVTGIRASSTQLGNLYAQNAEIYGDIIGLPGSSIYGFSSIETDNISSTFSADNVGAGTFQAGNFAFGEGSRLGVNMPSNSGHLATLHVNGTGYFSSIVRIGIDSALLSNPGALNIANDGSAPWLNGFNKGIRLENNSAIEFGGGSNGTLYGIGASSSRLYIFNTDIESNSLLAPNYYNLTLSNNGVGVGIGATNPLSTLHVSGTLRISGTSSGFRYETSTALAGRVLTLNASGEATWADSAAIAGGSLGSTVRHNGSGWIASNLLYNNGNFIGVSTTAEVAGTLLRVGSGGYFQFDRTFSGQPSSGECTAQTTGRITLDTTNSFFYVCVSGNWRALKLSTP